MTESVTTPDIINTVENGGWSQFNEERLTPMKKYALRNPSLIVGISMLFGMLLLVGIGHLVWDTEQFRPLSSPTRLAPTLSEELRDGTTAAFPFGTDTQGRDLLAVAILGTPLTLRRRLGAGGHRCGVGCDRR